MPWLQESWDESPMHIVGPTVRQQPGRDACGRYARRELRESPEACHSMGLVMGLLMRRLVWKHSDQTTWTGRDTEVHMCGRSRRGARDMPSSPDITPRNVLPSSCTSSARSAPRETDYISFPPQHREYDSVRESVPHPNEPLQLSSHLPVWLVAADPGQGPQMSR